MSSNEPEPVCAICAKTATQLILADPQRMDGRVVMRKHGEPDVWLCADCEAAADEVLAASPAPGTPYQDDLRGSDAS